MLLKLFICKIDTELLKTVGSKYYWIEKNNHNDKKSNMNKQQQWTNQNLIIGIAMEYKQK